MFSLRAALLCVSLSVPAYAQVGLGTSLPSAKLDIHHTSAFGSPTLNLYDLGSNNFARLQFQNASGAKYWHIAGLLNNTDSLARLNIFHSTTGDVMSLTGAGRVGVGTSAPAQKLDVAGNMQISGAIMPAGNPGNAGQYLRSGGGGAMSWGDAGFQNQAVFTVPSFPGTALNTTWTVPAGVTKIRVEMWSGGGHGGFSSSFDSGFSNSGSSASYFTSGGGGGGGAFCSASLTVAPAQALSIHVPAGGEGGNASIISGSSALYLNNGNNGNNSSGYGGVGGVFGGSTGSFTNVFWQAGEGGSYYKKEAVAWYPPSTTSSTIYTSQDYGKGGSAAQTNNGGVGGQRYEQYQFMTSPSTQTSFNELRNGRNGGFPGGGGGGGRETVVNGEPTRGLGAGGMIVIHY